MFNPNLGVPIRVVEDASVGGLEVDPEASSPRAEDVDEDVRVLLVEHLNVNHALDAVGGPVESAVLVAL